MDKHSSLFGPLVSYEEKSFIPLAKSFVKQENLGMESSGTDSLKTFYGRN
jgi:hypothetical protein